MLVLEESGNNGMHYFVGGGIASLAAAVFLVRDVQVPGRDIKIFEQLEQVGGSLDGSGGLVNGYLVRGGRMFEEHFVCTADLLGSIPTPDDRKQSLWDDILAFNRTLPGSSKCRLVRAGKKADVSLGLGARDILKLNRMLLQSERGLQGQAIASCFSRDFFDTNFWIMWSTMFSFQPWHSAVEMRRYLKRFVHLFPGFSRIEGILRTRYNQYDSIITPIVDWLSARGVRIETGARVSDIEIKQTGAARRVSQLIMERVDPVSVQTKDRVYLTLGSMTDASTRGSNTMPPPLPEVEGGAWSLWRKLAERSADFGNPNAFCADPIRTTWMSFTATMQSPEFRDWMEKFTGNVTGTGGLVTIADSNWLLSLVMFHQPHFRNQAKGAYVFWGYGLRGDRPGDYVRKPMWDCSGDEVLSELAWQLDLVDSVRNALGKATIVTCRMPYITSQFMPRRAADRPPVRPEGAENFALLGQYCEMPRDTVFTVEYSVRSAMTAVHSMTGKGRPAPPVVRTDRNPAALLRAARTLLGA
jgi:oleate hydratase